MQVEYWVEMGEEQLITLIYMEELIYRWGLFLKQLVVWEDI